MLAAHRVLRRRRQGARLEGAGQALRRQQGLDLRREDHEAHPSRQHLHALPAVRPQLRGHRRRHRRPALGGLRPGREPHARPERRHVGDDERLTQPTVLPHFPGRPRRVAAGGNASGVAGARCPGRESALSRARRGSRGTNASMRRLTISTPDGAGTDDTSGGANEAAGRSRRQRHQTGP